MNKSQWSIILYHFHSLATGVHFGSLLWNFPPTKTSFHFPFRLAYTQFPFSRMETTRTTYNLTTKLYGATIKLYAYKWMRYTSARVKSLRRHFMFERRENEHNWWCRSILITQRWRLEEETEISIWINRHPQDDGFKKYTSVSSTG